MKKQNSILIIALLIGGCLFVNANEKTQTIKGTVVDKESQVTLPGANIVILETDPLMGTITDPDGIFRIDNVPVGRYNIQASYIGYEPIVMQNILVGTGKEIVLNMELQESILKVDEVVVRALAKKDQPLNSMAMISARSFTVEETRRYAGGLDDPARMAAGFAGVVASPSFSDNRIVIRGNSPKGLLWRLDGVDIPNPNHFGDIGGSGGGVSVLSGQLLSNSDFCTGAFPAEYGNALSGVFDIRLRNGNSDTWENAIQVGMLGIDIGSEGPFSKKSNASYLFNYRYSLLGLVGAVMYNDEVGGVNEFPVYQDLSIKINVPTKKAGTFTLTGISGIGSVKNVMIMDSTKWETELDLAEEDLITKMGALILSNKYSAGSRTFLRNSLIFSGNQIKGSNHSQVPSSSGFYAQEYNDMSSRIAFNTMINHKFGAKHTNRTGFNFNYLYFNTDMKGSTVMDQDMEQMVKADGNTNLLQAYTQSKIRMTEGFSANAGMHFQYLTLNNNYSIEPRASIKVRLSPKSSLSAGYGLHSQIEHIGIYMADVEDAEGNISNPNMDLDFTKSHHFVLGFDYLLTDHLRIKIEPYYQYLYDVPVVENSFISLINSTGGIINEKFVNKGTGTNIGIDITFERFLHRNYYYLVTTTFYDSKYKGGDNIERNTRFNGNFAVNGIFGKEFYVGRSGNNILGVNGRIYFSGGERYAPLDEQSSLDSRTSVYEWDRAFEAQLDNFLGLDLTITYRTNREKYSGIWALQIKNLLNSVPPGRPYYDSVSDAIETYPDAGIVPFLSYKIEF